MLNLKIFESPQRARRKLAALAVTGLAVAGVGAALLGTSSAATTITVNDDTTGPGPAGATCGAPDHPTIGAAITAAASGDTILVCAGTYAENVIVNKDLTISGAQAGVDARGRVASESTVTAAGNVVELRTGSAGTTLDGFTVMGGARGITSTTGPITGVELLNNRVVGFTGNGVFLNDSGIDINADQNVVDGTSKVGGGALFHLDTDNFDGFRMTDSHIVNGPTATGFFVDGNENVGPSPRTPLLDGNLFDGNETGANLGTRAFDGGAITANTFSDSGFDGLQGGIQNTLIDDNEFTDNGRSGLALTSFGNTGVDRGAQNTDITNNEFSGNIAEGIFFSAGQATGTISTNEAHLNNIAGNTVGARYLGTETINVDCNWWGSASGPTHPANPSGTGDSVVDDGDGLDYTPWLIAAAPGGACLGPLPVPQSKDDCKKGGWQNLTDDQGRPFKNQGDCVSYVSTNGRNKAAG